MKNYDIILFDFDGTLIDQKEGITKSVKYALEKLGRFENDLKKLEAFIGPPLTKSFSEFYNLDEKTTLKAVEFYRERYRVKGIHEFNIYPGAKKLLSQLKNSGKTIVLATSKPQIFSEQILTYAEIKDYFNLIVGDTLDFKLSSKTDMIKYILDKLKVKEKDKVVMIGDRKYDIIGATNNKIDSIGVTYGFGSVEELKEAGATYIINSIEELDVALR